jgi:hypothetical protein
MFKRVLPFLALLGLAALPATARPAEQKKPTAPGLVLRVQSLDELMANFRYLAGLVGREEQAKQLEGILKDRAGGPNGFEGVDAKRPMALYAVFDEGGIENSKAVGLIPIADEKAFLALIEKLDCKAEKDKNDSGLYLVTGESLKAPVYFRFANRHAYVTALNKEAIDKDKILPPGAVLPPGRPAVLSLALRIDQIPQNVRDLAVDQVQRQLDAAKEEKKDDETPAQHAAKVEMVDLVRRSIVSALKEGGELGLRLDVDQKAQELSAELSLAGKEGSPLAKSIAELGQQKSVVAGLIGEQSTVNFAINFPTDAKLGAAMQAMLRDQFRRDVAKESDAEKKAQAEKIFKALEPAIKFTDADAAVDFRGPTKSGLYTLVGGIKVADGTAADRAFRDVVAQLPAKERSAIQLDADKAGGVAIHRIDTKEGDANFKKSFGDGPAYLAVRADAAFVAVGDEALAALKEALKVEPKVGKPLQFEASLAHIAAAMAQEKPEAPQAATKAFGKNKGSDKVRFALEAGSELKMRFVMKTPVLTFLHLMEGTDAK